VKLCWKENIKGQFITLCVLLWSGFFLFSVLKNQPKLKMKEWQQSLKYNKGTAEKKFLFCGFFFARDTKECDDC